MNKWIGFLPVALLLAGCGGDGGCEPYVPQTANIRIYDATTGMPAACGAAVTIGPWTETQPSDANCNNERAISPHLGAGEFQVVITKPGYLDWTTDIDVPSLNRCATLTEPAELEVFLLPAP